MKKAFSLIEVIIAIIIMSGAILIFPLLLNKGTDTAENLKNERSVFYEQSIINTVNLRYFDENNTKPGMFYKVLQNEGDSELRVQRKGKEELANNPYREGTTQYTLSNIGIDDENASDPSTFDDVDDFNGYTTTLNGQNYTINVFYISDDANYSQNDISFTPSDTPVTTAKTNIKEIEVSTTGPDGTVLRSRYYTSNIGSMGYYRYEEIK